MDNLKLKLNLFLLFVIFFVCLNFIIVYKWKLRKPYLIFIYIKNERQKGIEKVK